MRASSLYLALGVAPLATCAPIYRGSVNHVGDGPDAVHGGAPAPTSWMPYSYWKDEPRPERHESSTAPSAGVSHHTDDDILPPLSKHRNANARLSGQGKGPQGELKIDEIHVGRPARNEDEDVIEFITSRPHYGRPRHQDQSSRERNDMLVVFLAIAFMAAVVLMETWGRIFRR